MIEFWVHTNSDAVAYLAHMMVHTNTDAVAYLAHMMVMDLLQPHQRVWLGPGGRARQLTAVEPTRNKRGSVSGALSDTFWRKGAEGKENEGVNVTGQLVQWTALCFLPGSQLQAHQPALQTLCRHQ